MRKLTAIYPGTFDPVTLGHLDVLERASKMFDRVIIAASEGSAKATLFTLSERLEMLKSAAAKYKNVKAESFEGLLVHYAEKKDAKVIVRGLRAISDFEYEFQMALTNRKIFPELETVFLMPNEKYSYISSTFVREISKYGGEVSAFVPALVKRMLRRKYKKLREFK